MNNIRDSIYWKYYSTCPKCKHPMEIIYSNNSSGANPGYPTQYFYEIKYRCLHCFNIEWERDGT